MAESRRTPVRFRSAWAIALVLVSGCGTMWDAPVKYAENPGLTTGDLKGKTKLHDAIRKQLVKLFGPSPREITVFPGSGLTNGGTWLANYVKDGDKRRPIVNFTDPGRTSTVRQIGGYGLYRMHCLHCHGVSGDGAGPTAEYLYPRPRDYRKGLFKFTSTGLNKPTRADLERTIRYGVAGTSMPAFDAMMNDAEIHQVIEYVMFLSMRGETESYLIEIAKTIEEKDADTELSDEACLEAARMMAKRWSDAPSLVMNPPIPREPATDESILRGRDLFLAINKSDIKVECAGCHGTKAAGDGLSFVERPIFDKVVFWGKTLDEAIEERHGELEFLQGGGEEEGAKKPASAEVFPDLKTYSTRVKEAWKNSLDEWGNPLRPANLNLGRYKGGRRPLDLYWRIANGVNGAKMPGHSKIPPERIWDIVNFILELPYRPELLEKAPKPPAQAPAQATARVESGDSAASGTYAKK